MASQSRCRRHPSWNTVAVELFSAVALMNGDNRQRVQPGFPYPTSGKGRDTGRAHFAHWFFDGAPQMGGAFGGAGRSATGVSDPSVLTLSVTAAR